MTRAGSRFVHAEHGGAAGGHAGSARTKGDPAQPGPGYALNRASCMHNTRYKRDNMLELAHVKAVFMQFAQQFAANRASCMQNAGHLGKTCWNPRARRAIPRNRGHDARRIALRARFWRRELWSECEKLRTRSTKSRVPHTEMQRNPHKLISKNVGSAFNCST